jgi:hypothetical protein
MDAYGEAIEKIQTYVAHRIAYQDNRTVLVGRTADEDVTMGDLRALLRGA